MSDIICISTSDEEEEKLSESTKDSGKPKISNKRKASSSSSEDNSCKKPKTKAADIDINVSHGSNENVISPRPGTSKSFDEIEKKIPQSLSSINDCPIKKVKPILVIKEKVCIPDSADEIFEKFKKACMTDSRADTNTEKVLTILHKKFNKLNEIDKNCENFKKFLNEYLNKITKKVNKFYQTIAELSNEIKRRINLSEISKQGEEKESDEKSNYTKRDLVKIKALEKAIQKCKEKIQELEEAEVDFDADEDSAYLQEDRYKRKMVQLCEKLSEITRDKMLKAKIKKKKLKVTDVSGMTNIIPIDQAIIDSVNSSIQQMNRLKHIKNINANPDFIVAPDYVDVLKIIKTQNIKGNHGLNKKQMETLAQNAFKAVCKYLQKRRTQETAEFLSSYADDNNDDVDPATTNPELRKTLLDNKVDGDKKLNDVFKKYEDIQSGLSPEELEKQMKVSSDSDIESEEENSEKNQKEIRKKAQESEEDKNDCQKNQKTDNNVKDTLPKKQRKRLSSGEEENEIITSETGSKKENCDGEQNETNIKIVIEDDKSKLNSANKFKKKSDECTEMNNEHQKNFIKEPTKDNKKSKIFENNNIEVVDDECIEILSDESSPSLIDNPQNKSLSKQKKIGDINSWMKKKPKSQETLPESLIQNDVTESQNFKLVYSSNSETEKTILNDAIAKNNENNDSLPLVSPVLSVKNKENETNAIKPLISKNTEIKKLDNLPKLLVSNKEAEISLVDDDLLPEASSDSDIIIDEDLSIVEDVKNHLKSPMIKVKKFGEMPKTWKDAAQSPEKIRQKSFLSQQPNHQFHRNIQTLQFRREKPLNTDDIKMPNPLALNNRRSPSSVVIVKTVTNNINVLGSVDKKIIESRDNPRDVYHQGTIQKSSVILKHHLTNSKKDRR